MSFSFLQIIVMVKNLNEQIYTNQQLCTQHK